MEKIGLAVGESKTLEMLEKEKEKAIRREVEAALRRSRELQSDFLGLGDRLYREHPDVWEKVKDDWRDDWLPNVAVEVKITSELTQTGLVLDPLFIRQTLGYIIGTVSAYGVQVSILLEIVLVVISCPPCQPGILISITYSTYTVIKPWSIFWRSLLWRLFLWTAICWLGVGCQ